MIGKPLRIIPLGGLGEVGKNMMAYEYEEDIILVDTGIMFPENDMLGVDYIIPDFKYLLDKVDRVKGIFITHGHEDHLGAIHHVMEVLNAPIYANRRLRSVGKTNCAHECLRRLLINLSRRRKSQSAHLREFFHFAIPFRMLFRIDARRIGFHSATTNLSYTPP